MEDNRIRQLDYGVQINRLLYTRLIKGGNITLFSPNEVSGLYEAFLPTKTNLSGSIRNTSKTRTYASVSFRLPTCFPR